MERLERRWSTRKNIYVGVDLQAPSYSKGEVPATLLDISLGGAFIGTRTLLPAQATLTIKLKLPGCFVRSSFRLNARIVHCTPRGVGVSFVGVPAGVIHALCEALSKQEKQPKTLKPYALPGFAMNKELTS